MSLSGRARAAGTRARGTVRAPRKARQSPPASAIDGCANVLDFEAIARDRMERAFYDYYAWQVFVRTRSGLRRITGPGL